MADENKFPQNETFEHFLLKNIGGLYLKHNQLCNFVAEEFIVRRSIDTFLRLAEEQFDWEADDSFYMKDTTDALGFKAAIHSDKATIKNIEAKYSYSDFKNNFCIAGEYNYVIAPIDVIPKNELPPFVGLIEVNFDEFYYTGRKIKGYNIKKRAKRIKISKEQKDKILKTMKRRMLYKLTEDKYSNHWLNKINLSEKYKDKFNQGVMKMAGD